MKKFKCTWLLTKQDIKMLESLELTKCCDRKKKTMMLAFKAMSKLA